MPGDIGDARLNNYFLERVFLRVTGEANSFWNMDFFFPFPLVGGFSDNHFGSALFYIMPRLLDLPTDTAFQLWFLFGYILNFISAYIALRKMGIGSIGASVGGVIFAFALPTSGHSGHAQLHHRWALPFAVMAITQFMETRNVKWLGLSLLWVVLQFYIGIYSGFFSLFLVGSIAFVHWGFHLVKSWWAARGANPVINPPRKKAQSLPWASAGFFVAAFAGLGVLFFPYFQVSRLYMGSRSWAEISTMLPRPVSYFIADHSTFWGQLSSNFADVPMRHEHQMFIGLIPLVLLFVGAGVSIRNKDTNSLSIFSGGGLVVLLSLSINGASLWFTVHELPLVSAIRAVTRVDQTLLFVAAYGAAISIDWLLSRLPGAAVARLTGGVLVGMFVIAEASTGTIRVSHKSEWRERVEYLSASIPTELPAESVLFFAQKQPPWFASEIDAMWVSLLEGRPTMNGYSGQYPPGWRLDYGNDCLELLIRLQSYAGWVRDRGLPAEDYEALYSRVTPIGFDNCQNSWMSELPVVLRDAPHSVEEFSMLQLTILDHFRDDAHLVVTVSITNAGVEPIRVRSKGSDSIKLSWAQPPELNFDTRFFVSRDLLPGEITQETVRIPLGELVEGLPVHFSLVQELVFWGHDVGVDPAVLEGW
jgi:hypothetical protein